MTTNGAATNGDDTRAGLSGARRGFALVGGGLLVLRGLTRPSLLGLLLASAGVSLVSRAVSGHWLPGPLRNVVARHAKPHESAPAETERDSVDEASWQSFPASDPPSYSPR
jgi:hypothetical protein